MTNSAFERAAALFAELGRLDATEREARIASEPDAEVRELVREMVAGDAEPMSALTEGLPGLRGLVGEALSDGGVGLGAAGDDEQDGFALEGGPYSIEGVLAKGGMGVVFRGRDESIGRAVAIKVLRAGSRDRRDARVRFVEEAQVAGQLEHPGIVPIHHLGNDDRGRPFFAMKLVEGRTLAELLAERRSPRDELARFLGHLLRVCQTVAYAHARGVIHRDLKPANVMIGAFGEVQVLDWGLAKVLSADRGEADEVAGDGVTASTPTDAVRPPETARSGSGSGSDASLDGTVMGTPGYMPPEQAQGEVAELDRRSDVFSLGAILCEVLTGSPPFSGTRREALRATREGELAPAYTELDRCGADPALVEIARRCLAADPEERPVDAGELASAIERSLGAAEERARAAVLEAERADARARSERRARRLAVSLSVVVAGFVIAIVSVVVWQAFEHERAVEARSGEVEAALDVAEERFARARDAGPLDLGPWTSAAVAFDAAARLAAPRDGSVGPSASVDGRLAASRAAFETAHAAARATAAQIAADRAVTERFEHVRAPTGDGVDPYDYGRMRTEYEELFRAIGLPVEDYDATAAALRGHRLGAVIGPALDQWSLLHRVLSDESAEERNRRAARLLWLASAADPHPRREAIRQALRDRDTAALLAFAGDAATLEPESVILLAGALRIRSEPDAAITALRAASRRHPSDFWLSFHTAIALRERAVPRRREDLVESLGYFRAAIAARPDSRAARHLLGQSLEWLGRWEAARDEFAELVRRAPDDGHARAHLANCIGRSEGQAAALPHARAAAELAPDDPFALAHLARALIDTGDVWAAVAPRRRAWEVAPSLDTGVRLAEVLSRTGDVDGELQMWGTIATQDAATVTVLFNAGTAFSHAGHLARAEELLRRAIEVDPDFARAHCNLASALLQRGRFRAAAAAYRDCHAIGTRDEGWSWPSGDWLTRVERARGFEASFEAGSDIAGLDLARALERAEFAAYLGRADVAAGWYELLIERPDSVPRDDLDVAALMTARAARDAHQRGDARAAEHHVRHTIGWLDALRSFLMTDFRAQPRRELQAVRSWLATWRQHPDLIWLRENDELAPGLREVTAPFWAAVERDLEEIVTSMDRLPSLR